MLIAFIIAALILTVILWIADSKTEWNRYLSGIMLMGAIAGFSDEINIHILPFLRNSNVVSSSIIDFLYRFHGFLTQFCEHIGIFLVVMYCVSYSDLLQKRKKWLVTIILFSTSAFFFFKHPWLTTGEQLERNVYTLYYRDLSLWGVPALITGLCMLFVAYFKERNPGIIRQRFTNLLIATPLIISGVLNFLFLRAIGFNFNLSKINLCVMFFVIGVFISLALRRGALGVKIRIDYQSVLNSIDNISEGTAIINHTLKDEVGKIHSATCDIKEMFQEKNLDREKYKKNIDDLNNSVSTLNVLIGKMKNFSSHIKLKENVYSIEEILNLAVTNISVLLDEKKIDIIKNYKYDIKIECDKDYMVEALTSILKNACEALCTFGKINISLYGKKNILYISINDNGPGIKNEHLSKVLKSYFTTKESSNNLGFGLTYAYKIINKHQGELNIISKVNFGTTVIISLPNHRIKSFDQNLPIGSKF